ncbi:MAG: hypothetical protein RLZ22_142 [Verrucomicrobiota bacterium]|jgi:deoxyribodipyrimidine photolyase-related protein
MEIALIHPHQLFANHPAIAKGRHCYLFEDPLIFGNDARWPLAVHQQKLVLHRASMQAYAAELMGMGHEVSYIDNPGGSSVDSAKLLDKLLPQGISVMHIADPEDDVMMMRLRGLAKNRGLELRVHDSPNFLTPTDFLATHIAGKRKPFMASFYQAQRKRMRILIEDDESPIGGKWSFDADNRAKLPSKYQVPSEPRAALNQWVTDAIAHVKKHFSKNPGDTENFRWPVTRADSMAWLDEFFAQRFANFGAYEDAISTRHAYIHHAAITPMLNIGLLDPKDVISRALARTDRETPLNSLEGFIRQVIGWREFMRGIYRHHGRTIRRKNFWGFDRPMPAAFYNATTGIEPVDHAIRQVLRDGYCHHIERLMILGNFMLLCRIRPDEVYRWFMELFVDAYDWVMVPNVYGMSQFADGGTFTTKPYLSGSNYVLKMSDHAKGPWCATWDGLFWTFIADYPEFFGKNPRLSMMAKSWKKMPAAKQTEHRQNAENFLKQLR